MVTRLACTALGFHYQMIFISLYHSWPMIQYTRSNEQQFHTMTNQSYAFWKKLVPDVWVMFPTGPSALRNFRYSCVYQIVWSWYPLMTLSDYGPQFCSNSHHLNRYRWLPISVFPSTLATCANVDSGGLLRSCNPGVSATHLLAMAWYPGGTWLSVMQLSGWELLKSTLEPGARMCSLRCCLDESIHTGNSLK